MDARNSYSTFRPPADLAGSEPALWSPEQAQRYLTWLTSVSDKRIRAMLDFLNVEQSENSRSMLDETGRKAAWVLRKPEFSYYRRDGPIDLTDTGFALAADLGLLVARSLLQVRSAIRWEVLKKPKNAASYRQPVLVGFGKLYLDPVRGSTAEAFRVIRDDDSAGMRGEERSITGPSLRSKQERSRPGAEQSSYFKLERMPRSCR